MKTITVILCLNSVQLYCIQYMNLLKAQIQCNYFKLKRPKKFGHWHKFGPRPTGLTPLLYTYCLNFIKYSTTRYTLTVLIHYSIYCIDSSTENISVHYNAEKFIFVDAFISALTRPSGAIIAQRGFERRISNISSKGE